MSGKRVSVERVDGYGRSKSISGCLTAYASAPFCCASLSEAFRQQEINQLAGLSAKLHNATSHH